jgi:hypothetical protein
LKHPIPALRVGLERHRLSLEMSETVSLDFAE